MCTKTFARSSITLMRSIQKKLSGDEFSRNVNFVVGLHLSFAPIILILLMFPHKTTAGL